MAAYIWPNVDNAVPTGRYLIKVPTFEEITRIFYKSSNATRREAIQWIRWNDVCDIVNKVNFLRKHIDEFKNLPQLPQPNFSQYLPKVDLLWKKIEFMLLI